MMTPKDLADVVKKLSMAGYSGTAVALETHNQAQRAVIEELTTQRDKLSTELANSKAWKDDWELEVQEHHKSKAKIEQQAKEIAASDELLKMNGIELTSLIEENKTLRQALQTCQSRLGCGCGDILCATCSGAYDLADQALKEVS